MPDRLREKTKLTEEEKKKIARDMIEGYKKMASINKKLAEDGFIKNNDGAKE